ncbi:MAG: FAD:protein FMN transferase, partial [Rhodomicrobium sp.]
PVWCKAMRPKKLAGSICRPGREGRSLPMTACESFRFTAMGTGCELLLHAEGRETASAAAEAAIAEVQRIERAYSRYRTDSIVHAINLAGQTGGSIALDAETAGLIGVAVEAYRLSNGLFDITSGVLREIWNGQTATLPSDADVARARARIGLHKVKWKPPVLSFSQAGMLIDFGGIGKEYAADRAAVICRLHGISHGLVNLGGDIAIAGPNPDGSPWRIGISDPRDPRTAVATLFAAGGGIATSGGYERYWEIDGRRFAHILNPLTGWPVAGFSSVTVSAETCLAAGLYATVAMLKEADGPRWLRENHIAHAFAEADGSVELNGMESPRINAGVFQAGRPALSS